MRLSGNGTDKEILEKELHENNSEIQHLISDVIVGVEDGDPSKNDRTLVIQHRKLGTAEVSCWKLVHLVSVWRITYSKTFEASAY